MAEDTYRTVARLYDNMFGTATHALRLAGLHMFRPAQDMNVLDVGCGTGAHLALYRQSRPHLFGIDSSPAMLDVARKRLRDSAVLTLADATAMPYADAKFDMVMSMLTLHGMPYGTRAAVVREIKRVLKDDGRLLLIDFHPGPYRPLRGWTSRAMVVFVEFLAGREHFHSHLDFMRKGGLAALASENGLTVQKQHLLAGGVFAIQLSALA
jgi:ubiquinone/menaquinone biosynthesis C-methylase UbiE